MKLKEPKSGTHGDNIRGTASKVVEITSKITMEMFAAENPFEKAAELFGKNVVGTSLANVLATQCSGVVGVLISTLAPTVS